MAALGIQGAAKYQASQYKGLLQKDLAAAMRDSSECKLKVANSLMAKLLSASITPRLPQAVREVLSSFVLEGNSIRKQWLEHLNQSDRVQAKSANAVVEWHNRLVGYLERPSLGVTYVARFANQKRSSASYPSGMSMKVGGMWDLLHSDLETLNKFIKD
jgi:hypothetical protein